MFFSVRSLLSSSTVAVTDADLPYCSIRNKSIDHTCRGHGSTLDTLSRTGRQFVDGYFYAIGSKRLCYDGVVVGGDEGALGMCWTWRNPQLLQRGGRLRGERHGGPRQSTHRQFPQIVGPLSLLGVDGSVTTMVLDLLGGISPGATGLKVGYEPGSSPRYFSIIDGQASDCTSWNSG